MKILKKTIFCIILYSFFSFNVFASDVEVNPPTDAANVIVQPKESEAKKTKVHTFGGTVVEKDGSDGTSPRYRATGGGGSGSGGGSTTTDDSSDATNGQSASTGGGAGALGSGNTNQITSNQGTNNATELNTGLQNETEENIEETVNQNEETNENDNQDDDEENTPTAILDYVNKGGSNGGKKIFEIDTKGGFGIDNTSYSSSSVNMLVLGSIGILLISFIIRMIAFASQIHMKKEKNI
ncbi:MAG: hypothetical protein Q4F88_01860 [Eubacteriales bacterium]|nr:hypothetical protein [Eubacteriales bacterium]